MPFSLQLNVIQVPGTDINIRVYDLNTEEFEKDNSKLQVFGHDGDQYWAFEITGWKKQQLHIITEAIEWYAAHIKRGAMEITIVDPRPVKMSLLP